MLILMDLLVFSENWFDYYNDEFQRYSYFGNIIFTNTIFPYDW